MIKKITMTMLLSLMLFASFGLIVAFLEYGFGVMQTKFFNDIPGLIAAGIFYSLCVWISYQAMK